MPADSPGIDPRNSRRMLIVLAAMFAVMWLWKAQMESAPEPPVPYSMLYRWIDEGKVASVVLTGDLASGELRQAESLDGRSVQAFRTTLPAGDQALLPLLRDKAVRIEVKSPKQPFAVEVFMTLLPWVLIIGVWIWMSRRAQRMMGAGGGRSA